MPTARRDDELFAEELGQLAENVSFLMPTVSPGRLT